MTGRPLTISALMLLLLVIGVNSTEAAENNIAEQLQRVLMLRDYNTRVVLLGTTLLGICGGIIGVFMLLRNRSLIGDVVGHSALPGIAIAFILTETFAPGNGKNVPILLAGAFSAGLIGSICVMLIDRYSRIKADAAMAIVLSLFYGGGTALLTVVQRIPTGSAAGLNDFLVGKTASLVAHDVWLFAIAAAILSIITAVLFKELCLLCFDEEFAAALGWNVFWLDGLLTGLVVSVTILGMQSVGLLLVVAILIVPPASSRFWTDNIRSMTVIAAVLGGLSAAIGTLTSALLPRIAAGAIIVLTGTFFFMISMLFGQKRGLIWRWSENFRARRRSGERDLLRAFYEFAEGQLTSTTGTDQELLAQQIRQADLLKMRTWSEPRLESLLHRAMKNQLVTRLPDQSLCLTPDGAALARRATRDHRLWEQYLITYAEIAPSHVDRDADQIEHVLEPEIIRELEISLAQASASEMIKSPHEVQIHQKK